MNPSLRTSDKNLGGLDEHTRRGQNLFRKAEFIGPEIDDWDEFEDLATSEDGFYSAAISIVRDPSKYC